MLQNDPLYVLPANVEARWINPENLHGAKGSAGQADNGRKGAPCYGQLKAGAQLELGEYHGSSGVIRHIWTTIDNRSPSMLRGLKMDFYWDGAATPAISVPWGDLFGFGLGRIAPFECAAFNSPEGRNFNSFLPMPFRSGFRVTVTNETDTDLAMFWFQADFTINDDLPANALYLHAYYHRENPTTLLKDYEFLCPIKGSGRFLGANFGVIADSQLYYRSWWGEGEVKIYVDGDKQYPTLCGTGTEDYILTSWGQGQYANAYSGCHLADHDRYRYCFYRYHLPDPIYFRHEIRATIQQIGCWDPATIAQFHGDGVQLMHGNKPVDMAAAAATKSYGLFERKDDWSSCAYFYLNSPTNELPPLDPVGKRIEGLDLNK
jgi:hypothetical protein